MTTEIATLLLGIFAAILPFILKALGGSDSKDRSADLAEALRSGDPEKVAAVFAGLNNQINAAGVLPPAPPRPEVPHAPSPSSQRRPGSGLLPPA